MVPFSASELSYAYIAGLAEAEGCIRYSAPRNNWSFKITQKSSALMLRAIKDFYQCGFISGGSICWSKDAQRVIKSIRPFLVGKAEQADMMLAHKDLQLKRVADARQVDVEVGRTNLGPKRKRLQRSAEQYEEDVKTEAACKLAKRRRTQED